MEKQKRLRNNRDFTIVYKKGKGYSNRNFTFVIRKNNRQGSRVGFSITKKFGHAVERNSLKRKLREIFRINFDLIKNGYDIVVIPRQNTRDMNYQQLEKSIIHLLKIVFKEWLYEIYSYIFYKYL